MWTYFHLGALMYLNSINEVFLSHLTLKVSSVDRGVRTFPNQTHFNQVLETPHLRTGLEAHIKLRFIKFMHSGHHLKSDVATLRLRADRAAA